MVILINLAKKEVCDSRIPPGHWQSVEAASTATRMRILQHPHQVSKQRQRQQSPTRSLRWRRGRVPQGAKHGCNMVQPHLQAYKFGKDMKVDESTTTFPDTVKTWNLGVSMLRCVLLSRLLFPSKLDVKILVKTQQLLLNWIKTRLKLNSCSIFFDLYWFLA